MKIFLLLIYILLVLVLIRIFRNPSVSPILSLSLIFHFIMWHAVPIFIRLFLSNTILGYSIVSMEVFIRYAIIEESTLLIACLFLLRKQLYFRKIKDSKLGQLKFRKKTIFFIIIIGAIVAYIWMVIQKKSIGALYIDRNAFIIQESGSLIANISGSLTFFNNLLISLCFALILNNCLPKNRLLNIAGWVIILCYIFNCVSLGARLVLLTPPMLILIKAKNCQLAIKKRIIFVVITLFFAGILSLAVGNLRGTDSFKFTQSLEESRFYMKIKPVMLWTLFINGALIKFDNISRGAFLVEKSGSGSAGLCPYLGSILSVVPRIIMPNKPVPGSMDYTYSGLPSRFVPFLLGNTNKSYNVGVSPTAISIWQNGYFFGPLLMVLCNVLSFYILNSFLLTNSIILKTLALYVISIPNVLNLFIEPNQLLMIYERIMVLFVTFLILHHIYRKIKTTLLMQKSAGRIKS